MCLGTQNNRLNDIQARAFYPSENFACIPSKVIDRISNVTQAVTLTDAPPGDIIDDGADRVMILYVFATQIFHE